VRVTWDDVDANSSLARAPCQLENANPRIKWVSIFFVWRPNLPDEGDNHVVELAVAGSAAVIITRNISDFTGGLKFPGLQVLTPAQFLRFKSLLRSS